MKTLVLKNTTRTILAGLLLMFIVQGCERSVDGLEEPGFTENPDVFIDGFSSGLEYYPFEGSRLDAFSVDNEDTYDNTALAMRFDVPNEGDPQGSYAGAIFRDDNGGRDLTSYNALTFYAKGSIAGTINEIGFGQDFFGNEYAVTRNNLKLTTNWEKYVIPIPDASVLTSSQGLFWYAEGPEEGDGYSFWVDEVKYENLSGLAQARPAIQNGEDAVETSFIGSTTQVIGLTFTINQPNGVDVTVGAAPSYFTFTSSDPTVATVNEDGIVSVVGQGTTAITASLGENQADGSLTIESIGSFTPAPTPTEAPEDVISIFSDAYQNVPVDFYNGFYAPFQTTTSNDFTVNGNNVLNYENFNFVGIEFNQNVPTIDGSDMTNLSVDIYLPNNVPAGSAFSVNLRDFGADDSFDGGDDTIVSTTVSTSSNPPLESGQWINIDLDISGMANKSNLGQIVFDSDAGPALNGATIYVDNIYLYKDAVAISEAPSIPISFDDPNIDYSFTVFNGATFDVVSNPDPSGSNATASQVGAITNAGVAYEGAYVDLENPLDLSNGATITADVYSTSAIPVLMKFEAGAGGAPDIELVANHSGNGWEELTWSFGSSDQYGRVVFFMDGPGTTAGTFYLDNISQN